MIFLVHLALSPLPHIISPIMSLATETQLITTAGLIHRVRVPPANGPHPTVVMLHGRSGTEEVMWVFARALPAQWLAVAPRAIMDDPDGGYAWHPRKRDEWPALPLFTTAAQAVFQFIQSLSALYQADLNQLYFMGFSQGAATALAVALTHPGVCKGIAGLVGFMPTASDAALATDALRGLPIFFAAGTRDETIPLEVSRRSAEALRSGGAQLDYREYEAGHKLNSEGMRDLKTWFEQIAKGVSSG